MYLVIRSQKYAHAILPHPVDGDRGNEITEERYDRDDRDDRDDRGDDRDIDVVER